MGAAYRWGQAGVWVKCVLGAQGRVQLAGEGLDLDDYGGSVQVGQQPGPWIKDGLSVRAHSGPVKARGQRANGAAAWGAGRTCDWFLLVLISRFAVLGSV